MVNITNIYAKAQQAIEKRNFEYAIEMLIQCISLAPDNLEVRKTLRNTARHMLKEKGSKSSGKLKSLFGGWKGKLSSKIKKDHDKAMIDYERSLVSDPNNAGLLRSLGIAAVEAGHIETAIWVFQDALKVNPGDLKTMWELVLAYELNGDIIKAQEICSQILEIDSNHALAARKVKALAAKETIDRAKLETAKSFRDSVKDDQAQKDFEIKEKILRTEEDVKEAIQFRLRQLEEEPNATRIMVTLGDLYKRLSDWDTAKEWYDKAYELDKADFNIQFRQGDLEIDKITAELRELKNAYKQDQGNADIKQKFQALTGELNRLKLEEYTRRVKAQPTVGRHHFNLGELLFKQKKYRESIAEFQKVSHDPEFRLPSLNYLGQAFHTLQNFDLAEKQYLEALSKHQIINEKVKPLLYNIGKLYIDMDRKEDAIQQLNKIYEVDINFEDVADLLAQLKS